VITRFLLVCTLVILLASTLFGQGSLGTMTGTVLDATGAGVPGAIVTAVNAATGVESRTTTTSTGAYTLPYLPPGTYRITVTALGFRTAAAENITLRVAQTQTVDVRMELGQVAEQVTVTAEAPLLESGSAEIGRYITTEEYKSWPIIVSDGQRQIQQFIFSSLPGTSGDTFQGSINGGQQYSHEILVEGIPLGRSDLSGGNNNEFSPSAEAISEFKLHTGAIGAQYNGGQTAIANFAIKSGTNNLHGSAFYYGQNEALRAFTLAENARGITKKAPSRQHNYGYSLGGPVYIPKIYNGRNRTFFFTNYENTDRTSLTISGLNNTLPVADFRRGDFSRLFNPAFTNNPNSGSVIGNDALGRPIRFGQIYDPSTTTRAPDGSIVREPFAGNIIPQVRFSPVARNIMDQVGIVLPDQDTMVRNTLQIPTSPFFSLYIFMVKGDHHVTDKHRVSGLYNHSYRRRNNNGGQRYLPIPGPATQSWQDQYTPGRLVRLSMDSTLTARLLNRIAGGYNRFLNQNVTAFLGQDWASKIGIQNTSPTHFPVMDWGGTEWQGGTLARLGSGNRNINVNGSWVLQDDVTLVASAHSFRFGYEYRKYFYNDRNFPSSGTFNFRPNSTWLPGFTTQTGHAFASFLLGAANAASRDVITLFPGHRQVSHGFYASDDWKITPRLTANLGLRWEVIMPLYEVTDRMSMVDVNVPNPGAGGRPGALIFADRFQDINWKQIGPRLGIAYRATDRMVLRAGYAITSVPPTANDWGYGGFTFGFNGSVPVNAGTSATGFVDDPAMYVHQRFADFQGPLPNTDPALGNFTDRQTTGRDSTRLGYTQNWNFTIQHELPARMALELAYIGNKGTRLWADGFANLNQNPVSVLALGDVLRQPITAAPQYRPYANFPNNRTVAQALRPFPQYTSLEERFPYFGNSIYNSLQVTATRHLTSGFGLLAAYTFSKAIGYENSNGPEGGLRPQDIYNRALERSILSFSTPHDLKVTWVWETPIGKGRRVDLGFLNYVLGGWKLSGIHRYRTGDPISVSQSGIDNVLFSGSIRPDLLLGFDQQRLTGAPDQVDFFTPTPYLNPAAFAPSPRTGSGVPLRLGTAPRVLPQLRGPHVASEDFRGSKMFPFFGEKLRFEVAAVATNGFNRTGRSIVTTDITSPNFGKLSATGGGRAFQLEGRLEW
jgi:hypothetical protein